MQKFNLNETPQESNKFGILARTLVNHNNATIKHLFLDKGKSIPNHDVPVDVTFFVLEGSGEITIDGETVSVEPYDVILCPPSKVMSVKANSNTNLSFLNIKTPGLKSLNK